jgi:hypothetical protein
VPGVYVDHNGPLTYRQREQAAVLHAWPAALHLDSALRAVDGAGRLQRDDAVIHLAVDRDRSALRPVPGITVHRVAGFENRVLWNASPPRMRYEEAVLDLAATARDDLAAVAHLAAACGSRRTTAARLLSTLRARPRIRRRAWLEAVLADVAAGTCSVLERGYQSEVVRPHGLPAGVLQARHHPRRGGTVVRDVVLAELGLYVELDGRLFHSDPEHRDRDLQRDLDAAVEQQALTLRLGFQQVFGRACSTAHQLGLVMRRRGWTGAPYPCRARLCGDLD